MDVWREKIGGLPLAPSDYDGTMHFAPLIIPLSISPGGTVLGCLEVR